jgi:2-polyprenyl-6-methoxyphenol hydroxylase-like FAD-dependent oxidoreductase
MDSRRSVGADMPRCASGSDEFGRALGRDVLDSLLLRRASVAGVEIFQPARVRNIRGGPGAFRCDVVQTSDRDGGDDKHRAITLGASLIVMACGSWEGGPRFESSKQIRAAPSAPGDLFAFKATFLKSSLPPGFLPVIALSGGYGGMVVANGARTTLAVCLRRDELRSIRARHRGLPAGAAVELHLRERSRGAKNALKDAVREGAWLTVGPLRPGIRLSESPGIYRVGNAAGESHPLVGEGMSMALQSSRMLVESLLADADRTTDARRLSAAHRRYAETWRAAFVPRLRFAAAFAQIAMRPALSAPIGSALHRWPALLTLAARCAGKARPALPHFDLSEDSA